MQATSRAITLSEALFPRASVLRDVALIVGFSWFVALLARLAFYPPWAPLVPITGQTLGVLLAGAALGSRKGALSLLAYLAQGAAGLPVFAAGRSGITYMMGPSGGYLVGFVVAALVVGLLAEVGWDRRPLRMALAMVMGNAIIYALGLLWLGAAGFVPGERLLASAYSYTYIPGDLLKLVLAAIALPSAWSLVGRSSGRS